MIDITKLNFDEEYIKTSTWNFKNQSKLYITN